MDQNELPDDEALSQAPPHSPWPKMQPPELPDDGLQELEPIAWVWKTFRGLPDQGPWREILGILREQVSWLYYARHLAPTYVIGKDIDGRLVIYSYIDEDAEKLSHQIGPRLDKILGPDRARFYDVPGQVRAALYDEP